MDGEEYIEFDSLINIRPRQNNLTRYVENQDVRERIVNLVNQFVK